MYSKVRAEVQNRAALQRNYLKEVHAAIQLVHAVACDIEEQEQFEGKQKEQIEAALKQVVGVSLDFDDHDAALVDVDSRLANGTLSNDADFVAELDTSRTTIKANPAHQATRTQKEQEQFQAFRLKVWQINHEGETLDGDEDADLVVVGQEDRTTCPITGGPLDDPVKSTSCGHTFSRRGIESLFQQQHNSRAIMCPVPACGHQVMKNGWKDDLDVKQKLKRKQRRNKKKKEAEEEEVVDVTQINQDMDED